MFIALKGDLYVVGDRGKGGFLCLFVCGFGFGQLQYPMLKRFHVCYLFLSLKMNNPRSINIHCVYKHDLKMHV